jgi:hypothetical protein
MSKGLKAMVTIQRFAKDASSSEHSPCNLSPFLSCACTMMLDMKFLWIEERVTWHLIHWQANYAAILEPPNGMNGR